MKREAVISNNLLSVGYDEENQMLEIEFKKGVYQYLNAPKEIYDKLMVAPSKGRFFHNFILEKYDTIKI